SIGNVAFCKAKFIEPGVTSEATTIDYIEKRRPSFNIPKVLYYHRTPSDDRFILFLQRVPGRTLDAAWSTLDESWKRHYVTRIAGIYQEMAGWSDEKIGGVDGQGIPEYFFRMPGQDGFDCVAGTCKALGMDCSDIVFYHADMGPTNIIVEEEPTSGDVESSVGK
ncbi:hypothetical protein K402DRAFT_436972, partial [Aulographum hederae CBS 113979]